MTQQLEVVSRSWPGDELLAEGNCPLYWDPDLVPSSNLGVCPGDDMRALKGSFGLGMPSRHSQ